MITPTRFLVTGANGLVGSRVSELLASAGHDVTGTGRGERRSVGAFGYVSCDLTRGSEVAQTIAAARPEVVIHCASMTDVDGCERDPHGAWAANVDGAASVAKGAAAIGAHLVHVSTDYVFDGDEGPYSEEDVPNPRGVYAMTKLAGEFAARSFVPTCAIARTAVVFDWPAAGRANFGSWLVGALATNTPVRLFEDQFISPSLAGSVAAMLAELGVRRLGGVWNTSGGEVVDRVTFGRRVCELFGFEPSLINPTRLVDMNLASPRPLRSGLLTTKAERHLEAKPLSLGAALSRFHKHWCAATSARQR